LFKAKKGENFNHRHTWSISRMEALRPKGGLPGKEIIHILKAPLALSEKTGPAGSRPVKFSPDAGIGQKGMFFKGLDTIH